MTSTEWVKVYEDGVARGRNRGGTPHVGAGSVMMRHGPRIWWRAEDAAVRVHVVWVERSERAVLR